MTEIKWIEGIRQNGQIDIICPSCGMLQSHFKESVLSDDGWGNPRIIIKMNCENGCEWDLQIECHEGQINISPITKTPDYETYLYFIEAVGLKRVKIGVSKDPEERLKQLQTGSPISLSMVAKCPGDVNIERSLHKKLSEYRVDGEWFHLSDKLQNIINSLNYNQKTL
jgi:hypothetical protein